MVHYTKYLISFRELHTNELWKVYIQERDYVGAITEIEGSDIPCITEYRPDNDQDYGWIKPSVCTVSFMSTTEHQFIEFFTSDNRKYKIKIYRDSVFMWAGWLIPDTFKEPYEIADYPVSISATDGLLSLKDVLWENTDAGEPAYTGKKSLMKAIEGCLKKLELYDVYFWDASYIYESHHSQGNDDSPLTQTYLDCDIFHDEIGKASSCFDVLLEILKSQNCQIWQENGCWNIVPQNARKSSYVRRKYRWSLLGTPAYYVITATEFTTETYDPSVAINNTNIVWYATPEQTFRPGWKRLILKHDYGFSSNVLRNVLPYFSDNFLGGINDKGYVINQNHYWGDINHGVNEYIAYNIGSILKDTYQKLKVSFKGTGSLFPGVQIWINGTTNYYLTSDGSWSTSETYCYTGAWNLHADKEAILSDNLPIDGILKIKIQAASRNGRVDLAEHRNYSYCSYLLSDFKIELVTDLMFYENVEVTTQINDKNVFVPEVIELKLGDLPIDELESLTLYDVNGNKRSKSSPSPQDSTNSLLVYKGVLYYESAGNYITTSLWTVKGRDKYNKLINVISDEISINHIDSQWIINGSLYGNIRYGSIITVGLKKYMILRGSWNAYNKEWELELFEIADTEQGYLRLRTGGYVKLRSGNKIKVR